MDEAFGKIVTALIIALGGVALSTIKSDDVIDKIMRAINVCENTLIKHLNDQIDNAYNNIGRKISWEFNRILAMLINKNKDFTIEQTEIVIDKPTVENSTLYFSKRVFYRIKKLDNAILRINIYRIIFWTLLIGVGLLTFLYVFNIYRAQELVLSVFTAMVFICILIYLMDRIIISNLIKNITKDYGLS